MKRTVQVIGMASMMALLSATAMADVVEGVVIQRTDDGILVRCDQRHAAFGPRYAKGYVFVLGATEGNVGTHVKVRSVQSAGTYKYVATDGTEQILDAYK